MAGAKKPNTHFKKGFLGVDFLSQYVVNNDFPEMSEIYRNGESELELLKRIQLSNNKLANITKFVWKCFSILVGSVFLITIVLLFFYIVANAIKAYSPIFLKIVDDSVVHVFKNTEVTVLQAYIYQIMLYIIHILVEVVIPVGWDFAAHFYLAVIIFRYTSRFMPLELKQGEARPRAFKWTYPFAAAVLVFVFAFMTIIKDWSFSVSFLKTGIDIAIFASTFIWLAIRHFRAVDFVRSKNIALFLRRFSSFANRGLLPFLLRQIGSSCKMVFLISADEPSANWDPVTTGISGFRAFSPFRTIVVVIRAQNELWLETVSSLVDRADLILIDTTVISDSIKRELDLLKSKGVQEKTIMFREELESKTDDMSPFSETAAGVVSYRKSWKRSIPRMAGLALVFSFLGLLSYFLLKNIFGKNDTLPNEIIITYVFFMSAILLYFLLIFVRPTVDGQARKHFKRMLSDLKSGFLLRPTFRLDLKWKLIIPGFIILSIVMLFIDRQTQNHFVIVIVGLVILILAGWGLWDTFNYRILGVRLKPHIREFLSVTKQSHHDYPYLRSKVVLIDKKKSRLDTNLYDKKLRGILAYRPDEVGSVVLVDWISEESVRYIDPYTGEDQGYNLSIWHADLTIIDWKLRAIIGQVRLTGPPPNLITGTSCLPIKEVHSFINKSLRSSEESN